MDTEKSVPGTQWIGDRLGGSRNRCGLGIPFFLHMTLHQIATFRQNILHFQGSVQALWACKDYVSSDLGKPITLWNVRDSVRSAIPLARTSKPGLGPARRNKSLALLEIGWLFVPCLACSVVTIPSELPWLSEVGCVIFYQHFGNIMLSR